MKMKSYAIVKNRKDADRSRTDKCDWLTHDDLAVIEGKPDRTRPDDSADRSNPFTPSTTVDASRSMRETAPQLEGQRQALLALWARLHGDVTQTADAALSGCGIETTCASPDTADRASEVFEQDLAVSLLGSVMGTLEQIEAALQHIDNGSYGHCVECGGRIPAARLEAIPYATCCVQCAARRERAA
ncbi:MAG: TraR/DksA family transcriptional regulator [Thermoguttaceae bacterium]|jgi:DnaK suppressor protein